jgi:hypothetical protein
VSAPRKSSPKPSKSDGTNGTTMAQRRHVCDEQHEFSLVAGALPDGLQMQKFFGRAVDAHLRPADPHSDDHVHGAYRRRRRDGDSDLHHHDSRGRHSGITLPGPTAKSGTLGQFYSRICLRPAGGRRTTGRSRAARSPRDCESSAPATATGSRARRQQDGVRVVPVAVQSSPRIFKVGQ